MGEAPGVPIGTGLRWRAGRRWCVRHDRPAHGFTAAVCPHDPSCVIVVRPADALAAPIPNDTEQENDDE